MNIYAKKGEKVKYTGKNGRDSDKQHANKYLKIGEVYTVNQTFVYPYISYVELEEMPSKQFNTVNFDDYEEKSDSLLDILTGLRTQFEQMWNDKHASDYIKHWCYLRTNEIDKAIKKATE